jgi:hypothetical protein
VFQIIQSENGALAAFFLRVWVAGAWSWPHDRIKVKNTWNCTSSFQYFLMTGCLLYGAIFTITSPKCLRVLAAGAREVHPIGPCGDYHSYAVSAVCCGHPWIRLFGFHTHSCGVGRGVAAAIRCVELRKHPPSAAKVNKGTPTYSLSPCGSLSPCTGLCSYPSWTYSFRVMFVKKEKKKSPWFGTCCVPEHVMIV